MANVLKLLTACAAFPALLMGSPAFSQTKSVSDARFAKSEAIIGAPSALAAILAQQGAPLPAAMPSQPGSYGLHSARYSFDNPLIASGDFERTAHIKISPAIYSARPDIFGTVALKVGRTRMDDKWHEVEHSRVSGSAAAFAASLRERDETARIEAINRFVNSRVRFDADDRQYGRADVWSTANTTLSRGRGDCEDYAIAKIQMLRTAGISSRDLYLVVLKDLARRADHAVAVVRSGGRMYVLDNGTDELFDSETVSDYRPVLTFSAVGTWTHGYRVTRPVVIASGNVTPFATVIPASAGENQRSRSASLLAFKTGFSR